MNPAGLIKLGVLLSIALSVMALGMGTTVREVTSLLRQPGKLGRSLLVMNVLMPLFALLLADMFPFDQPVRIALVTLSLSPVLPLLPRKQLKAGAHADYVYSLYAVVALLSIIFIPAAVSILGKALGFTGLMAPSAVAKLVVLTVALPLAIGIALRELSPRLASRIAGPISMIGNILLLLVVIAIFAVGWRVVVEVLGNGSALAFVAFVVGGLVLGELFGGSDRGDRTTLALSNASRHPGIAIAIAGATFPEQKLVTAAVLVYLIVNAVVSLPYLRWAGRQHGPVGRPAMARH